MTTDRLAEIKERLDPAPVACPYCSGKGEVYVEGSAQYKYETPEYRRCSRCDGTGVDPRNYYSDDGDVVADVRYLLAEVERLRGALDGAHVGFHRTRADQAEIREGQLRADVDALMAELVAVRAALEAAQTENERLTRQIIDGYQPDRTALLDENDGLRAALEGLQKAARDVPGMLRVNGYRVVAEDLSHALHAASGALLGHGKSGAAGVLNQGAAE